MAAGIECASKWARKPKKKPFYSVGWMKRDSGDIDVATHNEISDTGYDKRVRMI